MYAYKNWRDGEGERRRRGEKEKSKSRKSEQFPAFLIYAHTIILLVQDSRF